MFLIDGIEYNGVACLVDAISESFSLLDGISSQRLQNNALWFDVVGTEVTHTITLRRGNCPINKWEELWTILRSPVASHMFTFPDGTNGSITYEGHVSGGSRQLDFCDTDGNHWGDYSITIIPISPQF